jgi:hypothetical protein
VENIIEGSGTPYFTFHDVDENKPTGSIKIRVETIDYFLQRYQEHLQKRKRSESELAYMVETYRKQLVRANAKAQADLEPAGSINISGNDSRPTGHRGLASDGLRSAGHGHDAWTPVTLDLSGNGAPPNGGASEQQSRPAAPAKPGARDGNVMRVNGDNARAQSLSDSRDAAAYRRLRESNTAGDLADEEFGSGSASCGLPTRDYPLKAYDADGQPVYGSEDLDEASEPSQFIKLGNFVLPRKESPEQSPKQSQEDRTPVEAD